MLEYPLEVYVSDLARQNYFRSCGLTLEKIPKLMHIDEFVEALNAVDDR